MPRPSTSTPVGAAPHARLSPRMCLCVALCAASAGAAAPTPTPSSSNPSPPTTPAPPVTQAPPSPPERQLCSALIARTVSKYETCIADIPSVPSLITPCECEDEADDRPCTYLRNLGGLQVLGAVRRGCSVYAAYPYDPPTGAAPGALLPEVGECAVNPAEYTECMRDTGLNKTVWSDARRLECPCAVEAMEDLFSLDCHEILDAVLPEEAEYLPPSESCGCNTSVTCLPIVHPTEDLPADLVAAYEITSRLETNTNSSVTYTTAQLRDIFQTAIAAEAGVKPLQVTLLKVDTSEVDTTGIVVWFRFVGLTTNTSAGVLERLEGALADEASYLRADLRVVEELKLIEDAFKTHYRYVDVVTEKEEVPAYMIALLVIFAVIIIGAVVAGIVMFTASGGGEDKPEGDEESGEDGEDGEDAEDGEEHEMSDVEGGDDLKALPADTAPHLQ